MDEWKINGLTHPLGLRLKNYLKRVTYRTDAVIRYKLRQSLLNQDLESEALCGMFTNYQISKVNQRLSCYEVCF